jgi:hypothetical protein
VQRTLCYAWEAKTCQGKRTREVEVAIMGIIVTCYLTFLQVAVGGLFSLLLSERLGNVTRGFLRLSGGVLILMTVIAWGAQSLITTGVATRIGFSALGIGLVLYWALLFSRLNRVRVGIGVLSLAGGLTALVAVLFDQGSWQLLGWSALVLAGEALALGAAWDGMLLGHWYLVTPRLTARPMRRLAAMVIGALGFLAALAVWRAFFTPVSPPPGNILPLSLLFWGWLAAGCVFPAGVTTAARVCSRDGERGRAMQAATGLMYLSAVAVLAGAIVGNLLLLSSTAHLV